MSWPPPKRELTVAQKNAEMLRRADARRGVKVRAPKATREWDFQEELVGTLRPLVIAPARFWFVPNGGNLSKAQAGRFKAMGLTKGVHDLHFLWTGNFGTLELKAGDNSTSQEQDSFGQDMEAMGHRWAVAHAKDGVDAAIATLRSWGFPLRPYR